MILKLKRIVNNYIFSPVEDIFFPPLCYFCDELLPTGRKIICQSCWSQIKTNPENKNTIFSQSYFDNTYILFDFEETIRILIHLLKYDRYISLAEYFAKQAFQNFPGLIHNNYSIIVPVPLHRIRFRERGYNQSTEIAKYFGKYLSIKVDENILIRNINTPSQTGLNKKQRIDNMSNAFTCNSELSNKNILLIDDVMTTGCTLDACAQTLKQARAKTVDIFSVASPPNPHEIDDEYLKFLDKKVNDEVANYI